MTGILHTYIPNRVIDSDGIADGSSIAFYVTGTLTPAAIYSDSGLTVPMLNPVVVAAGAAVPDIWLDPAITYRRIITYTDGTVDDTDPWSNAFVSSLSLSAATGAGLVGTSDGGTLQGVADAVGVPLTGTGTTDDSVALQAAIDALDGTGKALALTGDVNLRGTVYLGDNLIRFNGFAINCIIDGAYTQRGTGTYANEGVILAKSGSAAGYSRATVSLGFLDRATFNTVRSVDTGTVKTGVLLENIAGLKAGVLALTATGTGNTPCTPFDLFSGAQHVRIETIYLAYSNGIGNGGVWIRNFNPARPSCDIQLGRFIFSGDGADEYLAIFNSGDADADIYDVHIGEVVGTVDGGSGVVLSVFRNAGAYDPTKMRNITIGTVKAKINSLALGPGSGAQIVNFGTSAPKVGRIQIEFGATYPVGFNSIVGVRGPANGSGQINLPYIGEYDFNLVSDNTAPSLLADMAYGGLDFGRLHVHGSGSGFKYAGRYLRSIVDARVYDANFVTAAFDGVETLNGYVEGPMINVRNFKGTHVLNCDRFNAANWMVQNATASHWNNEVPTALSYDAEVRISGSVGKTVNRIILAQSNPTNPVPYSVRYRASNPSSLTVGTDDTAQNKAFFPALQYDAVLVNGATATRRVNPGLAEFALTDAATITPDFGRYVNFSVTLGGNRTLANPTNAKAGQSGTITVTQDATGSRTLAYGTNWRFPGTAAVGGVLSTAAGAIDILHYRVRDGGTIVAWLDKAMAA